MVTIALVPDILQYTLQVFNLRNAGTTEKVFGDFICCELAFAEIAIQFPIRGFRAGEGDGVGAIRPTLQPQPQPAPKSLANIG